MPNILLEYIGLSWIASLYLKYILYYLFSHLLSDYSSFRFLFCIASGLTDDIS